MVSGAPGDTIEVPAIVDNTADVAQEVSLYLASLTLDEDETPTVGSAGEGVGGWGAFEEPVVVVPAESSVDVRFRVTIPADAEPGDHLGAVVGESRPQGEGEVQVVKRAARRLYVTVDGDADPAVEIESVDVSLDRTLLARRATVTVLVHNTGNVRLESQVRIGGVEARGSEIVMSSSTERYVLTRSVPLWGGPLRWPVEVRTRTMSSRGPTATAEASRLVVPWWIAVAAFLLVVGFFTVRELRKRLA